MALSDHGDVRACQTVQLHQESRQSGSECTLKKCPQNNVALSYVHLDNQPKETLITTLQSLALNATSLQTLRSLHFGSNRLAHDACRALCTLITSSSSLHNLNLQSCKLQQRECKAILHALNTDSGAFVEVLELSCNNIGDQGTRAVADMLANNKRLTSLSLTRNRITDVGARAIFETLASCNSVLRHLDLSHNPTKMADPETCMPLRGVRLETLRLRDNGIVGGAALFDSLKYATRLKALDVSGCYLSILV
jgi:Ran GTPase-activating protein (RanGAP) involved in mRNA processing and transport